MITLKVLAETIGVVGSFLVSTGFGKEGAAGSGDAGAFHASDEDVFELHTGSRFSAVSEPRIASKLGVKQSVVAVGTPGGASSESSHWKQTCRSAIVTNTPMTTWEQNNTYNRSLNLLIGRGVPKDERKAFQLNAEAARHGHADAVLAMGWFYLNGVGVQADSEQATKWYRESARKGDARAMFSLGQIAYTNGDFSDAATWFKRASDAGHARSLYWMGKLYWRGRGVTENRTEAIQLMQRAARLNVEEASRLLRWRSRR